MLAQQGRPDFVTHYPLRLLHRQHYMPGEAIFPLLVKQMCHCSYRETEDWAANTLVLRWFLQIPFQVVPDFSMAHHSSQTIQPETLHHLSNVAEHLVPQAKVTERRKLRANGAAAAVPYSTDSSLRADRVRVSSRRNRRSNSLAGKQFGNVRDAFRGDRSADGPDPGGPARGQRSGEGGGTRPLPAGSEQ